MARSTTTFTKTVTGKVPYHFVCNYCGRRNDKVQETSGAASKSIRGAYYGNAEGTAMDVQLGIEAQANLLKNIKTLEERIRDYSEGVREGRTFRYSLSPPPTLKGEHPDHLSMDATCAYCGKKQAWSTDPTTGTSAKGCLITVLGFLLFFACLFGATSLDGSGAAVLGVFGFAVLIGSYVLSQVLSKRRIRQNQSMINAEPNDPDKLPVLDLEGAEKLDHAAAPDEQLDSPAKITVIRESTFYCCGVKPLFRLNNTDIGRLSNGESVTCTTLQKHNTLYAIDDTIGNSFKPLVFEVTSGGEAKIVFRANKFLPGKSTGIKPI